MRLDTLALSRDAGLPGILLFRILPVGVLLLGIMPRGILPLGILRIALRMLLPGTRDSRWRPRRSSR